MFVMWSRLLTSNQCSIETAKDRYFTVADPQEFIFNSRLSSSMDGCVEYWQVYMCAVGVCSTTHSQKITESDAFPSATLSLPALSSPHSLSLSLSLPLPPSLPPSLSQGGDLDAKICQWRELKRAFEETLILDWFIQLTTAIKYIHDRRILHRDLKTR